MMRNKYHFINNCCLCDELESDYPLSVAIGKYPDDTYKVLCESEHLVVLHDISPIVSGHCLIVFKNHIVSYSLLVSEYLVEILSIKEEVTRIISDKFERPFFFEHGCNSGSPHTMGCINHAHLHVIPYRIPLELSLGKYSTASLSFKKTSLSDLQCCTNDDYLYYEDQNGMGCVCKDLKTPLPHQLIRMIVAYEVGRPDWNWRDVLCCK